MPDDEKVKVLVAEDEKVSRMLLEKTLTKAGFQVTGVEDGLQAIELFKVDFFPIVLTDWVMPKMGGPELCRALRQMVTDAYVYIVLLTARDTKDDIVEGLKSGADDYLTKPFHPAELLARLNTGKRILNLERSLKKANAEIRLLSITDSLTGCFNRTYLNANLEKEMHRARRYKRFLSIILADIDHFKVVNDTYGHLSGDDVLRVFVDRLRSWTRKDLDWIARFGGEEFIIVLPETELEKAEDVAERLRSQVAASAIALPTGNSINITASFGVTGFSPNTDKWQLSQEEFIARADSLLYKAKANGRNRVESGPLHP
jgi:diguanylate cyclase (GGDEF)-like protein